MLEFTLTERQGTIMYRFMECRFDTWLERIEEGKKMSQDELDEHYDTIEEGTEELDEIALPYGEKEEWFQFSASIEFNHNEGDVKMEGLMIAIHHKKRSYTHHKIITQFLGNHFVTSLEDAKKWINTKVKTYIYCKCDRDVIIKDGWCKYCYPFVMNQEDDCSVCMENSGVWVELKCKHKIHEHCFKNIENKKCPLCRKVSDKIIRL